MDSYIVHPENKEQVNALKAIFKALKVEFTKAEKSYDAAWEAKMKKGAEDKKAGRYKVVKTSELWK